MQTWGDTTCTGYTAVSRFFLRNFHKIGISHTAALLTIQILDHQYGEHLPCPTVARLAVYMDLSEDTVRKHIGDLRKAGWLVTRQLEGQGNLYDFSPLMTRLNAMLRADLATKPSTPRQQQYLRTLEEAKSADLNLSTTFQETPAAVVPKCATPVTSVKPVQAVIARKKPTPAPVESTHPRTEETSNHSITKQPKTTFGVAEDTDNSAPSVEVRGDQVPSTKACSTQSTSSFHAEALAMLTASRAKTAAALEKRAAKRALRPVSPPAAKPIRERKDYTVHDMLKFYSGQWAKTWPSIPSPLLGGKELALVKKMLDHYGPEKLCQIIEGVFGRWQELVPLLRVNGYPSIALIFGYRESIVGTLFGAKLTGAAPAVGSQWQGPTGVSPKSDAKSSEFSWD